MAAFVLELVNSLISLLSFYYRRQQLVICLPVLQALHSPEHLIKQILHLGHLLGLFSTFSLKLPD
jgi:hypothetical protein